jgi:hypothetical protein
MQMHISRGHVEEARIDKVISTITKRPSRNKVIEVEIHDSLPKYADFMKGSKYKKRLKAKNAESYQRSRRKFSRASEIQTTNKFSHNTYIFPS